MHKSIFNPFIGDPRAQNAPEQTVTPSQRIITPATAMTLARPVLAGIAAERLLHGKPNAFVPTLLMGASDMDGKLARFLDKHFPDLGIGSTEFGAKADTYMDAASLLLVAGAILRAPRVPLTAKTGTAMVLGRETAKAAWAYGANNKYKQAGGEGQLFIQPTKEAKAAMGEEFSCMALAALSNDLTNPLARQTAGLGALYFGATGALRGNQEVGLYKHEAVQLIRELQITADVGQLAPENF